MDQKTQEKGHLRMINLPPLNKRSESDSGIYKGPKATGP